jgi:flagellar assembly factor FliW
MMFFDDTEMTARTMTTQTLTTQTLTTRQEVRMPERSDQDTDIPMLDMVHPLAGFPEMRRFALARLDDSGLVCNLRSIDDPELSFIVVPSGPFFNEYSPEINDQVLAELRVDDPDELIALLVVTIGETSDTATANLLAPVLVNLRTRLAGQYLLDDVDLPMRAPLSPASAGSSA